MARLPAVPILLLLAAAASAYLPPFNSPVATPAVQIGCDITYSQYTSVLAAITSANGAPPSFAPPTYQSDPLSCPLKTNCRAANPATPFTCWDGSCAASPIACNAAANFVCPASPILQTDGLAAKTRCWDGSCSRAEPWVMRALIPVAANGTYGTLPACPPLPTCGANQIRCYDLSCQDAPSSGDPLAACAGYSYAALVSVCTALAAAPGNYSTGYQCCGQQSGLTNVPGICGTFRGCDLGQVMCRDGSCVNSTDYAAGACNTGCKAGEFRCYGKTKGNCTTNAAECPPPPATSLFVSEFVATVYPTTANATRLPLRSEADGSDLGWVDVPPVNAQGAVHWNVFNYMLGSQVSDPRRSLCSGDWDTCKYAPLQIFSPMVGIVSYDLLLYYAEGAATFDKTLSKAVDGWALEVALPVQLPANVKANKMCLAFVAYDAQGSVPQRGQGDWRCVDRNAVLADNSSSPHGPIYRGYAPLSLVMRGEPFTHFAFVHDVSDDFGPVESIGGGFFAAGIALLVVGGTFLLANREKLMGRIYNDGAGTSTSAM